MSDLTRFDPETRAHLGFGELLEALALEAKTPQGRAACLGLQPSADPAEIHHAADRYRQLLSLLDAGQVPPIEPIDDVASALERAEKGGVLSAEQVREVARAMRVASQVRDFLLREGAKAGPELCDLARGAHDHAALAADLSGAFEPDGRLRDSASVELQKFRRAARQIGDLVRERLERMMRSARIAALLTDTFVTQRSDRYVLPIRADARAQVPGIVHDTSQSGATLFIEPNEVIDDGNRLKIAVAEVAEEERRILQGYSREIGEVAPAVRSSLVSLADFDRLLSAVRLGERLGGRQIEVGPAGLALRGLRHPLMVLAGERVIPNDVELSPDRRALVITGPNAGGKTVVLKAVGLSCLMAQAGLPIPALDGSRLGLFEGVAAVVGDSQDLHRGLSTFSAHVERIARILDGLGPRALVLLDELTADTDPRHGAALAAGILEEFVDRGAVVLCTTHFEELKLLPFEDERFQNASVGFDLDRMEPTFALHPDIPGRSLTLDIARRLGLAGRVVERAAGRLEQGDRALEAVLQTLEDERQALARTRLELEEARAQAHRAADEHNRLKSALDQSRQDLLQRGRDELLREIEGARREVAELIETLKKGGRMREAVQASQRLLQIQAEIRARIEPEAALAMPDLETGDRVRVLSLDRVGEVAAVDRPGGMVTVRLGSLRMRVPFEGVVRVAGRERRPAERRRQPSVGAGVRPAAPVEVRSSANTLDLRGQRVDEALSSLDLFLDRLFGAGEPAAFVIHGHGTGALKAAVREYLSTSAYPRHFRSGTLEEGGDGVTVIALK